MNCRITSVFALIFYALISFSAYADSEFTSLCSRSEVVRKMILNHIKSQKCDRVSDEDLKNFLRKNYKSNLQIYAQYLPGQDKPENPSGGLIKPGDFDGFENLTTLEIYAEGFNSRPFTLTADHLRGLSNLESLLLRGSKVSKIDSEVFKFTPKIKSFTVLFDYLNVVSKTAFEGALKLETLDLGSLSEYLKPSEISLRQLPHLKRIDLMIQNADNALLIGLRDLEELTLRFPPSEIARKFSWPKYDLNERSMSHLQKLKKLRIVWYEGQVKPALLQGLNKLEEIEFHSGNLGVLEGNTLSFTPNLKRLYISSLLDRVDSSFISVKNFNSYATIVIQQQLGDADSLPGVLTEAAMERIGIQLESERQDPKDQMNYCLKISKFPFDYGRGNACFTSGSVPTLN